MRGSDVLRAHRGDLFALLEQAYGGPPWHEGADENRAEADAMIRAADRDIAIGLLADGRLMGIAQGGPGTTFAEDARAFRDFGVTTFEFRQLIVAAPVQGQGHGVLLHDAVMREVRQDALLLTHPEAAAALRLYARRGWVRVGRVDFGPDHPRVILNRAAR